jgi:hypothetical protein
MCPMLRNAAMNPTYSTLWQWLTVPLAQASRRQRRTWLMLAFTLASLYGILTLRQAFSGDYVVQDDARQHVFWMYRWIDPTLFPEDLIADYFQSVAPLGYRLFYRTLTWMSLDPFWVSKVLPLGLGLVTTGYAYGLSLRLFPVPAAAFGATLLLNQVIWANDDIPSATPRAFVYPLLVAFLYYLLERPRSRFSIFACLVLIALQGLFYPQSVFLAAGVLILQLVRWQGRRLTFSRDRVDYGVVGAGLGVAIAILLPFALQTSAYGPVITLAEARELREFQPAGRSRFFDPNAWNFWIHGNRSGILPRTERLPPLLYGALLLPILQVFSGQFPLTRQIQPAARILGDLLLVSLFWFAMAHLTLFRLHLPSRYTQHSLRIVLCLAAAIALICGLDALLRWGAKSSRSLLASGGTALMAIALLAYPTYAYQFPGANYEQGTQPELYEFLIQQPPDIRVATLSMEADMIPSFAQRSVLVAPEYGIPYHMGYYTEFRNRAIALADAQYAPTLDPIQAAIREYNIDFWVVDTDAFSEAYLTETWVRQYPEFARETRRSMRRRQEPAALERAIAPCLVLETAAVQVLDAACLLEQPA